MAQLEIIWSHRARIKLYSILEFYAKRNKSKIYATKHHAKFNKEIKLLAKHPNLGIKTEIEFVRGLIVDEYNHLLRTTGRRHYYPYNLGLPSKSGYINREMILGRI